MSDQRATIVLDIGKTNAKLTLIAADGSQLAEQRRSNTILQDGPYPHHDTEGIWHWMLGVLRQISLHARFGFLGEGATKKGIDALHRADGVVGELLIVHIAEAAVRRRM